MTHELPIIRANRDGTPSVRGTRLTIYSIMEFYLAGDPAEHIAGIFDISLADVQDAIAYIELHRQTLTPEYNKIIERHLRGNPPDIEAKLVKSHEKLMKLKSGLDSGKTDASKAGNVDSRLAG